MLSLRSKLSISHIIVVLLCVILMSILSNFFLDRQFRQYAMENQDSKNKGVLASMSLTFRGDGTYDESKLDNIGMSALEKGLILKVKNSQGDIIWDATVHNNGMCTRILQNMADSMGKDSYHLKGQYVELPFSVKVENKEVATLLIGYYGLYSLSDNDINFIKTLNHLFAMVGLFSMILSFILGSFMSKKLSGQISKAISVVKSISIGNYEDKVSEKSSTKEVLELSKSINQVAENLKNQELLRKRLTGDISHELRTPLTTLRSYFEAMIDGVWKVDNERLSSCYDEILRLNRMVEDLEKLAKAEGEGLTLQKSDFDLSECVQNIGTHFEADFKRKQIKLVIMAKTQAFKGDKDKICQIIINILSNALKYTLAGGCVELKVYVESEKIIFSAKDTGIGISKEDLPFVFERFYRVDQSRTRNTGGVGIGLTITKALVEAHHGTITIESEVNQGTEVIVKFPLSELGA